MKSPILLVCQDDQTIRFYHSIETAESYMEAVDVRDGLYQACDGEGRPLNIEVIVHQECEEKHWWRISYSCSVESVKITGYLEEKTDMDELVELIKSQYDRILEKVLKRMQFSDLINMARNLNLGKQHGIFSNQHSGTIRVIMMIKGDVDVLFVDIAENAKLPVELDDALAGDDRVYDPQGRRLRFEVVNQTGDGIIQSKRSRTFMARVVEDTPRKHELRELSDIIRRHYNAILPGMIKEMDLAELVNLAKLLNLVE